MSLRNKLLRQFGIEEPGALTFRGWDEFHAKVKQEHPVAWFCIDTVPEKIEFVWNRLTRPAVRLLDAIRYRTRQRYHIINTGLQPRYQKITRRLRILQPKPKPESGLKYLQWEMTIDKTSPHQAEAAREIWQLYHWWKFVRPNRVDPMDASGWSEHCRLLESRGRHILDTDDLTAEERARSRKTLDVCREIEANYDEEDEEYLVRLIKIRKSLWT